MTDLNSKLSRSTYGFDKNLTSLRRHKLYATAMSRTFAAGVGALPFDDRVHDRCMKLR